MTYSSVCVQHFNLALKFGQGRRAKKVMWGHQPLLPSPSFPSTASLPSFPPHLFPPLVQVCPLIAARGSGSALAPPAGPGRARPQTHFCEFEATNLASSSNDLRELFRKWNINWRDWVAKWYCGNILDFHAGLTEKLSVIITYTKIIQGGPKK